jgi:hypothetical protein
LTPSILRLPQTRRPRHPTNPARDWVSISDLFAADRKVKIDGANFKLPESLGQYVQRHEYEQGTLSTRSKNTFQKKQTSSSTACTSLNIQKTDIIIDYMLFFVDLSGVSGSGKTGWLGEFKRGPSSGA